MKYFNVELNKHESELFKVFLNALNIKYYSQEYYSNILFNILLEYNSKLYQAIENFLSKL